MSQDGSTKFCLSKFPAIGEGCLLRGIIIIIITIVTLPAAGAAETLGRPTQT